MNFFESLSNKIELENKERNSMNGNNNKLNFEKPKLKNISSDPNLNKEISCI